MTTGERGAPNAAQRDTGRAVLVVLRGNSASGKTTTATAIQHSMERSACVVVPQDVVRRQMTWEPDEAGRINVELIEHIATFALARGLVTIVEGILDTRRYGTMLGRLADTAPRSLFYAFDLTFEETLVRHASRPLAAEVPDSSLAQWYHGWQPLEFTAETRIDSSWEQATIADRIRGDIAAARTDGPGR
ncbi:zeta toxin family protein [Nocardia sp. NBC_01503]|uniref:AAA family ATPase n=1 Tax=Nocardia sp. NBC_01503 TaxID=2975997 RepID=UPI002E7B903B|nr:AAA family ATPase [Nocardia sp. NBC_01503]WTL31340.1 zeta toxin family protein [Nocardia sp. NBC_01503]